MDSANFVTLMLIDKGYYDYDYEEPKRKRSSAPTKAKSDAETAKMLSRFGVGTAVKSAAVELKKMDMEQLQAYAMRDVQEARGNENNNGAVSAK